MADIKKDPAQDWDLSDEYYQENPQSDGLRLEDFMDSSSKESDETTGTFSSGRHTANTEELSRLAQLVSRATALSCQGKTIAAIAKELDITEQYTQDILVCVQAFPEDNPMAVAHMLMG